MSNLVVQIWDVQHGSAAFIRTPNGTNIIVDLGWGDVSENNERFSPVTELKTNWNVSTLHGLIVTHPHADHLHDIFALDNLHPLVIRRPKHITEDDIRKGNKNTDRNVLDKYFSLFSGYNNTIPAESPTNPFAAANNGGVEITTYQPTGCPTSNLNNQSSVTIIEYMTSKIVIPGDNEKCSWEELLNRTDFKQDIKGTDIFVASHHGRESGYHAPLFDHFKPSLVIISDGQVTETSVTDYYYQHATGWKVYNPITEPEQRYCLSTRADNSIRITCGVNTQTQKPYRQVNTGIIA